jgi:hypothetical protein
MPKPRLHRFSTIKTSEKVEIVKPELTAGVWFKRGGKWVFRACELSVPGAEVYIDVGIIGRAGHRILMSEIGWVQVSENTASDDLYGLIEPRTTITIETKDEIFKLINDGGLPTYSCG